MTKAVVRYFNVTMIDNHGSPSSTQILSTDGAKAIELIQRRVNDGDNGTAFSRPIVCAYIFDTQTEQLSTFAVDGKTLVEVRS